MRLTGSQRALIRRIVTNIVGADARVVLFGSRVNDNARGGDVDLLIESDEPAGLMQRAQIKLELESSLALPVDVIAMKRGATPTAFQRIALATGVPIGET